MFNQLKQAMQEESDARVSEAFFERQCRHMRQQVLARALHDHRMTDALHHEYRESRLLRCSLSIGSSRRRRSLITY